MVAMLDVGVILQPFSVRDLLSYVSSRCLNGKTKECRPVRLFRGKHKCSRENEPF